MHHSTAHWLNLTAARFFFFQTQCVRELYPEFAAGWAGGCAVQQSTQLVCLLGDDFESIERKFVSILFHSTKMSAEMMKKKAASTTPSVQHSQYPRFWNTARQFFFLSVLVLSVWVPKYEMHEMLTQINRTLPAIQ